MPLKLYKDTFNRWFDDPTIEQELDAACELVKSSGKIFFLGNGGSNSISGHMMEDYGKMLRKRTLSFSDPSLITCYANDYGYEHAMAEYVKLHADAGDLLIVISSSGKSPNILNAVAEFQNIGGKVITLSGFGADNPLRTKGNVNFYCDASNYGLVECFHQVILHMVLDRLYAL